MAAPLLFEDVYSRYRDSVYRYCLTQVGSPAVAEDVASDVFEAAWVAYQRAAPEPEWVEAWLIRIAKNRAINHHRRTAVSRRVMSMIGRAETGRKGDVEGTAAMRSDLRRALAAIGSLKGRDRQLVGLRVSSGLSFAQIGEVLNISEHAAIMATHRALERVRSAMEGEQ